MVLMKYFFFVIPVRLGVIITSGITIVENLVLLIGFLLYNQQKIIEWTNSLMLKESDDSTNPELYEITIEYIRNYVDEFWYTTVGIYAACLVACLLNIYAAISQKRHLSILFMLLRFIEILAYFLVHVNCMLYMKKYWNLGVLIAACCAGGFVILLFFYFWGVTVAMFQIIGIVNSKEYKAMIEKNKQEIVFLKKPKNQEISTIASRIDSDNRFNMMASDFYGVRKNNLRRIY